jgi:purine-binding chemotaxis protein CheW
MSSQFLTFKLEGSQYAVEVYKVQEVLEYTHITKVPCAAAYVEGLINSRGQGISVVNLRKKFGMPEIDVTKDTRIIVLEVKSEKGVTTFGAIADSVQEVIDLADEEIEPSPKFGNNIAARFIRGIGKRDDKFIILLDIDHIFSTDEIVMLEGVNAGR